MRRVLAAFFLLGLAVTPVLAQSTPVPTYDVAVFCHTNPGSMGEHDCVQMQYLHRSLVARGWEKVSENVRKECIAVNKWNDYEILDQCTRNR